MIRFLVAGEDALGDRLVRHVGDEVCVAALQVAPNDLGARRAWCSFEGEAFVSLSKVRELARQLRLKPWGKFDGKPGAEDAVLFRKLFLVVAKLDIADVLFVARDVDGTERRKGLEQALEEARGLPFEVVGALAQPEAEAWLVCVWKPETEQEKEAHQEVRKKLGFDPMLHSHDLTSTSRGKRDAKGILQALAGDSNTAEQRFVACSLQELCAAGEHNGLRAFVEVAERVLRRALEPA